MINKPDQILTENELLKKRVEELEAVADVLTRKSESELSLLEHINHRMMPHTQEKRRTELNEALRKVGKVDDKIGCKRRNRKA